MKGEPPPALPHEISQCSQRALMVRLVRKSGLQGGHGNLGRVHDKRLRPLSTRKLEREIVKLRPEVGHSVLDLRRHRVSHARLRLQGPKIGSVRPPRATAMRGRPFPTASCARDRTINRMMT